MKKTMKILAAFVVAVLANFAIAGDGCDLTTKGEGNRKEYFCGDTSYTFPGHINFADEFIAWTNESSKGGYTFDALGSESDYVDRWCARVGRQTRGAPARFNAS